MYANEGNMERNFKLITGRVLNWMKSNNKNYSDELDLASACATEFDLFNYVRSTHDEEYLAFPNWVIDMAQLVKNDFVIQPFRRD